MYLLSEGPGLEVRLKSVFEPNHVFVKLLEHRFMWTSLR